jgi:hypothetical protein
MLIYFMVIWIILRPFGKFYDHMVHFVFIWYIFSGLGIMHQEKSGNPDVHKPQPNLNCTFDSKSKFLVIINR